MRINEFIAISFFLHFLFDKCGGIASVFIGARIHFIIVLVLVAKKGCHSAFEMVRPKVIARY